MPNHGGEAPEGEAAKDLGQRMATVFFVLLDLCSDLGVQFDIEFKKFLDQSQAELKKQTGGNK